MTINQRVIEFIEYKKLRQTDLHNLGIGKKQTISNYFNLKTAMKIEFIENMKKAFPEFNLNWAFTGEGNMTIREANPYQEIEEIETPDTVSEPSRPDYQTKPDFRIQEVAFKHIDSRLQKIINLFEVRSTNEIIELLQRASTGKEVITITDKEGHCLYVSDNVKEQTGFPASDFLGKSPGAILQRGIVPDNINTLVPALVEHRSFSGELVNFHADGRKIICKLDTYPIGEFSVRLATFRDGEG